MADEQTFYRQVGGLIAAAREDRRRMTQDALAKKVSLTRTSITNIEKGRQRVSLYLFWQIAHALRVHPMELIPEGVPDMSEAIRKLDEQEASFVRSAMETLESDEETGS